MHRYEPGTLTHVLQLQGLADNKKNTNKRYDSNRLENTNTNVLMSGDKSNACSDASPLTCASHELGSYVRISNKGKYRRS